MASRSTHSPERRSASSSPYPLNMSRKTPAQPKSTRQQYSACGACRMRRVKCDLKDLPILGTGAHPPCSNCRERALNCVDEFAEVKAVKLLRRGRRLQKVEAVYGKTGKDEADLYTVIPPKLVIPQLKPEFFRSPFFRRLHIQRPVLEPREYCPRYYEWVNGNSDFLQPPGQLIALALAVWAASYGVDEAGEEVPESSREDPRQRRALIEEMLAELLYLVDIHGVLRKPTWDGVRALLLILPLMEDVQSPMERLAMHDITMNQVHALSSLAPSLETGHGEYVDALVRARTFWCAHVIDGVTHGLRGSRLCLTDEDLAAFETSLPPDEDDMDPARNYAFAFRMATTPLRISSACRQVHGALTGVSAQRTGAIDGERLERVWQTLEQSWRELEQLRAVRPSGILEDEDMVRFIDGWQIFLFECHNVIREALNQRLVTFPVHDPAFAHHSASARHRRHESYDTVARLHARATDKCHLVVRDVVDIIRRNLGSPFFQFDASLVRDGCFFAAFLLAGGVGSREDVEVCLQALSEMRWTFSKNDERARTIRAVCEAHQSQPRGQSSARSYSSSPAEHATDGYYGRRPGLRPVSVPPMSLSASTLGGTYESYSAPNTACTTDGRWPSAASASGSEPVGSHRSSPSVPSSSSSFVQQSGAGLGISLLHPQDDVTAHSPLLLVPPSRLAGPGQHVAQTSYYPSSYSYDGMDAEDSPSARGHGHTPPSVQNLSPTDPAHPFEHQHAPSLAYHYNGEGYSPTALGHHEAAPAYVGAAHSGQATQYGAGGYY